MAHINANVPLLNERGNGVHNQTTIHEYKVRILFLNATSLAI